MAISDKSIRLLVILPEEYGEDIDRLIGPGRRSRSAVAKQLIELALGRSITTALPSLPQCSVNKTITASCDQEAA